MVSVRSFSNVKVGHPDHGIGSVLIFKVNSVLINFNIWPYSIGLKELRKEFNIFAV